MSLIDTTYFINDISLPVDEIEAKLLLKIETYEPQILTRILGFDLYKKFTTGLDNVYPEQKWLDLRDGKEFQVNDIWYKWRGLLNDNKESLIAYYVWYKFVTYDSAYVSGSGIKQSLSENSQFTNPRHLQCQNYNQMVDWIIEMDYFITNNITNYLTYNPETIEKINIFNI